MSETPLSTFPRACASAQDPERAGLHLRMEDVTVCGKVTSVFLHGVVFPENATFRSVLLTGCALLGAAQLRILSMTRITQLIVVSTSGVCWLRRR